MIDLFLTLILIAGMMVILHKVSEFVENDRI